MIVVIVICITSIILSLAYYHKTIRYMPTIKGPVNLPFIGVLYEFFGNVDVHKKLSKFHSKYGHTFRGFFVNDLRVFTEDPDLIEVVSTNQNTLDKSYSYTFLKRWMGNGLICNGGESWQKRRKILTPVYHFANLPQFVDVFDQNTDILIERLRSQVDNDIDIESFVRLCALDVLCEASLGRKIDAQRNGCRDFVKATDFMCGIHMRRLFSVIKSNDFLYRFTDDYRKETKALEVIYGLTLDTIRKRRKELESSQRVIQNNTFLDMLLKSAHNGPAFSDQEISEEVNTFMFAGHDTTTKAVCFALVSISNHPEVIEKLCLELDEIFEGSKRPTTHEDLLKMKYMELVIKETMRMYPSVPLLGRSVRENIKFRDNIIPKGTTINMNILGLHSNPEYFPEPEKFTPERFLCNAENGQKKSPYAYTPFSAGPRNCLGQKFAWLEMKTIISKILRNFEILPTVPKHVPIVQSSIVLHSANGLFLRLKPMS